jgi:methylglyoxal synthase
MAERRIIQARKRIALVAHDNKKRIYLTGLITTGLNWRVMN